MMTTVSSSFGVVDKDVCCPGLPGAPQIQCTSELIALANKVDHLKRDHTELDRDVQEMNEAIISVNDRFTPCLSVGPSLTSCLAELSTIVTTQGQRLDVTEQQTTQAINTGARAVETLTTLVSKPQAQPASKVSTKRVCDLQSDYLVTQSQTKKAT
ncbi:hypothetical protein DSO57_1022827 [Entomophthora muscae]|uniref:Uncharacterized protein n=1 Tax=Entomophthora muscae TaxID=34485 RepID=A0ACC2RHN6_9FUNG|nr:hypothetical protein DSO57_1022827 [Entomophthora muscae]